MPERHPKLPWAYRPCAATLPSLLVVLLGAAASATAGPIDEAAQGALEVAARLVPHQSILLLHGTYATNGHPQFFPLLAQVQSPGSLFFENVDTMAHTVAASWCESGFLVSLEQRLVGPGPGTGEYVLLVTYDGPRRALAFSEDFEGPFVECTPFGATFTDTSATFLIRSDGQPADQQLRVTVGAR